MPLVGRYEAVVVAAKAAARAMMENCILNVLCGVPKSDGMKSECMRE